MLPSASMEQVCDSSDRLERAFDAFDLANSGTIDCQECLSFVSARGIESPYEASRRDGGGWG